MAVAPNLYNVCSVISDCRSYGAQVTCLVNLSQGATGCFEIQIYDKDLIKADLSKFGVIQILVTDVGGNIVAIFSEPKLVGNYFDGGIEFLTDGLMKCCFTSEMTSNAMTGSLQAEIKMITRPETGADEEVIIMRCIRIGSIKASAFSLGFTEGGITPGPGTGGGGYPIGTTSGTSGSSGFNGTSGTSGMTGPQGPMGPNVTSGTSGTSGFSGTDGTSGTSGIDGTSGTSGSIGPSGTDGTSGTSGIDGTSGTSGTSGSIGPSGTSGTSGIDGTSGTSGTSGSIGPSGTSGSSGSSGTSGTSGTTAFYELNYVQNTPPTGIRVYLGSVVPVEVVSVPAITTAGNPVYIECCGDAENVTSGSSVRVRLFRDNLPIGTEVELQSTAASTQNNGFSVSFIDNPPAGTYTYSFKVTAISGGDFIFGETNGPNVLAYELNGSGTSGTSGTSTFYDTNYQQYAPPEGVLVPLGSVVPRTIVELPTITTNGLPVYIESCGDAENVFAGSSVRIRLFRGNVPIGTEIELQSTAESTQNNGFSISAIDDVPAGSYTYSLKATAITGGDFIFGETDGPNILGYEMNGPGSSGTSGISGTSGTSGSSGTSGISGNNGTSGSNGTSGTSGSSGTNGTSGTSGSSGTSGTSGSSGTSFSSPYTGNINVTSGQVWVSIDDNGNTTSTTAVDWNAGNVQTFTLNANPTTFTFSNGQAGATYILIVKQNSAGSYTINWPLTVAWTSTPTMTATADRYDIYTFIYDGSKYFGSYVQNYA